MREEKLKAIKEKYPIGSRIKIIQMKNEPDYDDKIGILQFIDDVGQLHGTWGGCALIPDVDTFVILRN